MRRRKIAPALSEFHLSRIEPYQIAVPQADLDDLRERLARTRFPEDETVDGWVQGVPLSRMKDLVAYWREGYDWRACEDLLNRHGQYRTTIDGLDVHFMHVRSRHENALPLVLTHGWPGSILEFLDVIEPLTDPEGHGGSANEAFHLIIPSLPGYGFSGRPAEAGWGVERIARAWAELVSRLGYDRFVAQGGDWGSAVTIQLGRLAPDGLLGIHLNMLSARPATLDEALDPDEVKAVEKLDHFQNLESAYARLQATRPQTLGYLLADAPAGQAAWIYEKFQRWSDCNGDPETIFSRDRMLDNITLYWLTNTGASSARLYFESMGSFRPITVDLPVGLSIFPKEIIQAPRKWAESVFSNIVYWNELDRGGHFAAFEQPELFVNELRNCCARMR